jgi:Fe-S cluster assembly ATP-binding protein
MTDVSLYAGERRILDGLSIDIWEGHIHALVGPNGAGKSTTASLIMGLDGYRNYSGKVTFQGEDLAEKSVDQRARMGITLAWQEPARFEGLKVKKFIAAGARDKSESRVKEVIDQVGLKPEKYMDRALDRTLSGGERKRLELAGILAMEPRLVLMDEPDSGIDVEALDRIFQSLSALKDQGITIVLITHSLAVLDHAEHAFLMCCGKLLDQGRVDKIRPYFKNKCLPCEHVNQPILDGVNA